VRTTILCLTDRYRHADISSPPALELIAHPDGGVTISGVDLLRWREYGKRTTCCGSLLHAREDFRSHAIGPSASRGERRTPTPDGNGVRPRRR